MITFEGKVIPTRKIKTLFVGFEHDDGSQHSLKFDLTSPEDIQELASFMHDYYVVVIEPMEYHPVETEDKP